MPFNHKDPGVVEIAAIVDQTLTKVGDLSDKVAAKPDRSEVAKMVEHTVERTIDDKMKSLELQVEKLGNGILTDQEKMGLDLKTELIEIHEKFVAEQLQPIVGQLVEDEIKRKDRLKQEAAAKRKAEEAAEAARAETLRAQREARIYRWVSIAAVGALVLYRVVWPMLTGGDADVGAALEGIADL